MMGGSQGMGPLQEALNALRPLPVQCIVSTGVNRDLFRTLQKRYKRDRHVRLFGYTRKVELC